MDENQFQNVNQNPVPVPPPVYPPYMPIQDEREVPLSLGQWILTVILMNIPCVGFIMLLVWAFGEGNQSRKNFARAWLIVNLVVVVLIFVLFFIFGTAMASLMSNMGGGMYY